MSAESFPFSFCPAVHTIAALLLPSGLGFCVPDTQSQGELMQQRVSGGPCVCSEVQLGTVSPLLDPGPVGWGKGALLPAAAQLCCSSRVCISSCHWNFTEDRPSLLLQISALILIFVHPQPFYPSLFTYCLIVHICQFWPWFKARIESYYCFSAICHVKIRYID